MTTYYKAVRPEGTDFRTGTVQWAPPNGRKLPEGGWIVWHPSATTGAAGGSDAAHYLSVATAPTDCTGMRWPCRLLAVELGDEAQAWTPEPTILPRKRAAVQWRVVRELPAHEALGPQGEQVAGLIYRARTLSADGLDRLAAARDAAWAAAWDAAWDAARAAARAAAWAAARDAAWDAAWGAAWGAALGLLARDLITTQQYDALTLPWRQVVGRIHPDDPEVSTR